MYTQLTAAEAFRAGSMMISPRLNASRASLRSANERLRRMSVAAVQSRQHSVAGGGAGGTEETIIENGSLEHLHGTTHDAAAAADVAVSPGVNGRQAPVVSNGTAR